MTSTPEGVLTTWRNLKPALLRLSQRQLLVGGGITVGRAAGFLTGAIAARALGPPGFAVYTVGFTVFSSLMQLTTFAETWLVSRWGNEAERAPAKLAVWQIKIATAAATISLAVLAGIAFSGPLAGIDLSSLVISVAAAGAAALTTALASTFQAQGRFGAFALVVAVCPALGAVTTLGLALAGERRALWYLTAIFLSYLPTAALAYRTLTAGSISRQSSPLLREALTFGGWVTVGSLAYALFQRVDVFLMAGLSPQHAVGVYGVATRLAMVAAVFGTTITTVLMPTGSRRATWLSSAERRQYIMDSLLSIAVMTVAVIAGIAATPLIVRLAFGDAYLSAVRPTQILLLSQAIVIAQMPFYFGFYALNGGRWIAGLGIGQLAVSLVGGYVLIGRYGATGAAWSNVATYLVGAVVVATFHSRRTSAHNS